MDPYGARRFDVVDVTLSLDTSIFASGDVIADTQEIAACLPVAGGAARLDSVIAIDEDDQGTAIDLIFLSDNVTLGTENAAVTITDANARVYLGKVSIAAADFIDHGGVRMAEIKNIEMILRGIDSSRSLWVAAICRSGTPTYSVNGVKLRLGLSF